MEMIKEDKFVALTYDLFVPDDEETGEELMESADKEQPLKFVFGKGMMLPSFEEKLKGLKVGDKFDFILPAAEAYGEYVDDHVLDLPKNIFEVNGKFDSDLVSEGNVVPMMDADGNKHNALVMEVKADSVSLDFNHPLAGEDLHFMGEVVEVREATAADLSSCGGGCGSGCGDCGCGCDSSEEMVGEKSGGCGCGCGCG